MLTIQSKFDSYPQSMCEYRASKDGRYGWFLCTTHQENNVVLEEIQAEIKLEILNANVLDISKLEVENWMQHFFSELHWKLHGRFLKTDLREKGISLFFAVLFDCDLYFVQFGRVFCALTKGKKLETIGKNWKNYHIQSLNELNLLGWSEGDIKVKTYKCHIPENENFIVLPGNIASQIFNEKTDVQSIIPLIETHSASPGAMWLILKNTPLLHKPPKRKLTRLEITTLLLLLGTVLAIIYMIFGNRIIDVMLHRTEKEVETTQIKASTVILENLGKVVNAPARSIELQPDWNAELPYEVTAPPAFDQQNLYLVSANHLYVYQLKTRSPLWQKALEDSILSIHPTPFGLELYLSNNKMIAIDEKGNLKWTLTLAANVESSPHLDLIVITPKKDRRIDRSITVVPLERGISVLDSQQGLVMSELLLKEKLLYLSDYDDYNNCFYAIVGNKLVCIKLNVVN